MTGGKQVTPDTYIRQLPFSVIRRLCNFLDPGDLWMRLVVHIPKRLDNSNFEERYTQQQVKMFEERGKKVGGSATKSILEDWFTQNSRVKHLLKALCKAELYAAADYISVDVLKGEKVQRAFEGNTDTVVAPAPSVKPPSRKAQNLDSASPDKHDLYSDKITLADKQDLTLKPSKVKMDAGIFMNHVYPGQESPINDEVLYDRMESHESGIPSPDLRCAPPNYPRPKQVESDEGACCSIMYPSEHDEKSSICSKNEKIPIFGSQAVSFNTLRQHTDNFNEKDISEGGSLIGCGGFGMVFLGIFPNGYRVAIKQLKNVDEHDSKQRELTQKQFDTELKTLSDYRHENIVLLLGYSTDGPSKCLVYEYMPNGSLEDRLCCYNGTAPLSWKLRILISQGTAKGISYLNGQGLVHRDIKSANVLLDEDFTPKVGDFATVRTAPSGSGTTVAETTLVIGTSAYMAPEAIRFDISAKLDSFAFGVVLLELLTGLPPNDTNREEADLWSHIEENCEDDISSLLDNKAGDWDLSISNALFSVAKKCLADKKKVRVLVSEISSELDALLL